MTDPASRTTSAAETDQSSGHTLAGFPPGNLRDAPRRVGP